MTARFRPFRLVARRRRAAGANILNRPRIASDGRRAAPGIAAILLILLAIAGPAPAQAPATRTGGGSLVGGDARGLFEARGIPVDVTAATVTEARERALTQGRVAALSQVLAQLTGREDLGRMPTPPASQVVDMVREFSIANERTSAVRYIADMTVKFDPDAVRRLLRAAHIPFTEFVSRPMLVLPLFADGARLMLWEDTNPWREAWGRLKDRNGLVPLVLPSGDIQDLRIRAEQVLAKDPAALQGLAARYETGGVIVAKATVAAGDGIAVTVTEMRGTAPATELTLSLAPQPGQTREDVLAAAAAAAADAVAEAWKRANRVEGGASAQLTALVQVKDLKDWVWIRERLKDAPVVERVELQALTRDRAQITLRYAGDQGRLENALAQQSLSISQQGGVWIIASARKTAPAEAAQ
jgi:hypothetical protein